MDEYLERRIRTVFPTGVDWEPDKAQFDADGHRERLWKVIWLLQTAVTVERGWTHGYLTEFNMTLPEHPSFDEWQNMDRERRIAWLAQRGGKYPVLWLKVSRAADYFHFFFNTWVHKDSGIIDTTGEYGPTGRFVKFPELLIAAIEDMGFRQATPEMWRE